MARDRKDSALHEKVFTRFSVSYPAAQTIENGKKKLNEFCQQNRINNPDIQYIPTGPDNNRSFIAEIYVFIPKLHRKLYARETGSTKKVAGASAALSIVRQMLAIHS